MFFKQMLYKTYPRVPCSTGQHASFQSAFEFGTDTPRPDSLPGTWPYCRPDGWKCNEINE